MDDTSTSTPDVMEPVTLLATRPGHVAMVDTDMSGLLYYGAVYRWHEAVFGSWMLEIGKGIGSLLSNGYGFPCVHSEAQYRGPLAMDDEIEFRLYATHVGRTSFGYVTMAHHEGREEPSVVVRSRHVYGRMRRAGDVHAGFDPQPLPDWLVAALT